MRREQAQTVLALLFVAALLIVPLVGAATATAAAPDNSTATNSTSTTSAPTTTTNDSSMDADRVVSLINAGKAYAYAGEIEAWLAENANRLDEQQAATAYEWLLERAASADVDTTALASVTRELPEERARTVAERVKGSLSADEVATVEASLQDVSAEWSATVAGWFSTSGGNGSSTSSTTGPATGPNGYTVSELRSVGTQVSERPAIRRFGDGQLWLRYRTGGLLSTMQYITPSTETTVNEVRLGGFIGWDEADVPGESTVQIVAYETTMQNGTEVPTNVVERETDVQLGTGYLGPNDRGIDVSVPVEHGDAKFVTMWVEGAREDTQWTWRAAPSPASATVPSTTLAGRLGWAALHIGGSFLLTALTVLATGAVAVKKIGILPRTGIIGWVVGGSAMIFWIPLFFFQDLANAFAQRPELLGVLLGGLVGLAGIRMLDDGLDKALFVQPRLTEDALEDNADGRKWWWANRVHKVTTREKDGKMIAPRTGWLGALARMWPGYDAAPVIEFDGRRHKYEKPDDLDDDGHDAQADGGYIERIRTRIGGLDDEDEFDHIYVIDPTSEDVVVHESEGFEVSLPDDLVTWPDEGEGVRIQGVPIPHVNLAKILGGLTVMTLVGVFVSWLTTIGILGFCASLATLTLFLIRPTDGWMTAVLSPGHGGHIIDTVWRSADEFKEAADMEYWKNQALEAEGEKRVEHADELDDRRTTMFDEVAERLAPDVDADVDDKRGGTNPAASGSEGSADD